MSQMSGRGLRTLDEIRVGVVTITINVDTRESSSGVVGPLYQAGLDAERELYESQAQIADLETKLQELRDLVTFKSRVIDELADERNRMANELGLARKQARRAQDAVNSRDLALGELATEQARTRHLKDRLVVTDEDRAAMDERRNAAWARVNELNEGLAERDRQLAEISRMVSNATVDDALDQTTTKVSAVLATAILNVRNALSSSPDTETSQA